MCVVLFYIFLYEIVKVVIFMEGECRSVIYGFERRRDIDIDRIKGYEVLVK